MATRVRAMKVIAALALIALSGAVPSALGANAQTFLDSTGEAPNAPDITSVAVSNDDSGLITFKVNIANRPTLTQDMEIDLFLNADANASTGDPDAYGADYVIVLVPGDVGLFKWNGTDYRSVSSQSSLVYSYDTGGATIKVNASELGGTKSFGLLALAISGITTGVNGDSDYSKASVDLAPDAQHGAFTYQVLTTLHLKVTTFATVPSSPKAGGTLSASLAATESDTGSAFSGGTVACHATLGGKALPASAHSIANGVATCVWRVPKAAKGKRLSGTVTITVRGATATKSFSALVR
jgi:hypothetical protein